MKRRLFGRICVVATLATLCASAWCQPKPEAGYREALAAASHYCLGEVCLGMTIAQVAALGKLTFEPVVLPLTGEVQCSEYAMLPKAALVASDGARYGVNFDVVQTSGPAKSRYRLTSVIRYVPRVTQLQLDSLTNEVLARIGPMQPIGSSGSWDRDAGDLRFVVLAGGVGEPNPDPFIWLRANYQRRKDWLMSLPECRAGLPRV